VFLLRNDESHMVTVVLKTGENDDVYGITIPANGYEYVDFTSEFGHLGRTKLAFAAMKNGEELDSASQEVEVVISKRNKYKTDKNEKWINLRISWLSSSYLFWHKLAGRH